MEDRESAEFVAAVQASMSRGAWSEAYELAKNRLSLYPDDLEAAYLFVQALIGQGEVDRAIEALSKINPTDTRVAALYLDLGNLFSERGDWEKACYYFEKYLALFPASRVAPALKKIASELALPEEKEGGVVNEIPPDFQTMTLVDLYVKQGHLTDALHVLESMREKDPTNDKIIERIRGVQALMGEDAASKEGNKRIIAELDRWLQNIYKAGASR